MVECIDLGSRRESNYPGPQGKLQIWAWTGHKEKGSEDANPFKTQVSEIRKLFKTKLLVINMVTFNSALNEIGNNDLGP